MKKAGLFLFFILFSTVCLFGQSGKWGYAVHMSLYNDHDHDLKAGSGKTGTKIHIYSVKNGENQNEDYYSEHFRINKKNWKYFITPVKVHDLSNKYNDIRLEMRADCDGHSHGSSDWASNLIKLFPSGNVEYRHTRLCHTGYSSSSCQIEQELYRRVTGYADLYVFPQNISIVYKSTGGLILPSEDKIEIAAPTGYRSSVYKWVYKTSKYGTWKPISNQSLNGTATVKLSGKDIYGDNFENEMAFGGNTWVALEYETYESSNRTKVTIQTDPVTLENQKSAPYIESVTAIDATCNGYTDGAMEVRLSRPLSSNESLVCDYNGGTHTVVLDSDNKFIINDVGAGVQNIRLQGYLTGKNSLYTDAANHKKDNIRIEHPSALSFSSSKTDILCHDYHTGMVKIDVTGGNSVTGAPDRIRYYLHWKQGDGSYPSDSIPFDANQAQKIMGSLPHGEYRFYVTDYKGCFVKTPATPTKESTEQKWNITQPDRPITVSLTDSLRPSGFGLSNGYFKMHVEGGMRPEDDQKYTVSWTNQSTGTLLKTENLDGIYNFSLLDIPAGTYQLKVATAHCDTILQYSLGQPDPLIVDISQSAPILCNGDSNATLTAQVKGGVLADNENYEYEWYKVGDNDNITGGALGYTNKLENIGKGKYQVKVTDKSRIPNDTIQTILVTQPDSVRFKISTHTHVSCHNGNDAAITIEAEGGVGRYKVNYRLKEDPAINNMVPFGTGNSTVKIENLIAGTYIVRVVDGNDCPGYIDETETAYEVIIKQPEELTIDLERFKNPSGFGLSNGTFTYRISGGTFTTPPTPSYTVEITDSLSAVIPSTTVVDGQSLLVTAANLPKGRYTISVKDGNYMPDGLSGCINTHTIRLTEPELLTVKLNIISTVDCHGFNTGAIEATVAGGHAHPDPSQQSYIYEWVRIENGIETILDNTTAIISELVAGVYKVNVTDYSEPANQVSGQVEITQPPLQVTTLLTRNVSCFSGDDGYIHISVEGGVGGYRLFCKKEGIDRTEAEYPIEPDNKTFKLDRLTSGKYEIYIQDTNTCYAQIQGQDIAIIEIKEPYKALEIVKMSKVEPSGFGRSDGSITLYVNGGTPNPDNSYNLTWKNKQGQTILTTTQGDIYDGRFVSTLANQPDGEYTVEIRDGNYNIAYPDANTCCFVIDTYTLTEPEKLTAAIEETHYISCNGRSDGELAAHATGGVVNPDTGLPYKYKWYKENENAFIHLVNETDSILKNREKGNYKVEIEDYSRIVNTTSVVYMLAEPDVLTATSTQEHITCGQTMDVTAFPVGGTAPYRYEWNTGDVTQTLENRYPGKYFVFVTDSRGCETTSISHITTPSDLEVSGFYKDPVCYQAENGSITLIVKGGTAPYTYQWSNGAVTRDLNNIGAGIYTVTVTDKDGCSYSESFILEDPEPLTVDIGEDRTLCNGQELTITPVVEDPDTKFKWTSSNGFSSTKPSVTIKEAGDYFLTITDSKGCTASDRMRLYVSHSDISSEIVVASQVFVNDTIAIVNISTPEPDRIEWLFNGNDPVKVVQEERHLARIVFTEVGHYSVGFRSYVGDCYQDIIKTITVVEPDDILNDKFKESLIKEFYVAPNPNDGNFQVVVKLNKESAVRLRIINFFNGGTISDRSFNGKDEYRIDYSLRLVSTNLYLVLLETPAGHMVVKMLSK